MSTALSFLRQHAIAAVALLLLTAGGAYGVAEQVGGHDRSRAKRIHACVQAKTHVLTARRSCPKGSKKLAWNKVGRTGATGPAGMPGEAGADAVSAYAEFFALIPSDNASTVAAGSAVSFPQDGPSKGGIARTNASSIELADIGTYRVSFSVPVSEAGQLVVTLDGTELGYTVVGRATGTTAIAGEALVETTAVNSVLTVNNPAGNSTALTITPLAGGTHAVAATLIIEQLG